MYPFPVEVPERGPGLNQLLTQCHLVNDLLPHLFVAMDTKGATPTDAHLLRLINASSLLIQVPYIYVYNTFICCMCVCVV